MLLCRKTHQITGTEWYNRKIRKIEAKNFIDLFPNYSGTSSVPKGFKVLKASSRFKNVDPVQKFSQIIWGRTDDALSLFETHFSSSPFLKKVSCLLFPFSSILEIKDKIKLWIHEERHSFLDVSISYHTYSSPFSFILSFFTVLDVEQTFEKLHT